MAASEAPRTRRMTIMGQDPGLRDGRGEIVLERVDVPTEPLFPGPMGYRVHVVDYDTTSNTLYKALPRRLDRDPYERYVGGRHTERLLRDPQFHQQNVYAIVMETLGRFEFALGRRVAWAFAQGGHHLKVVPHAFADANAFYSRQDEALLFGYFRDRKGHDIFSCLSRDVVVHETTHGLLDGLRKRFLFPSSADQEAFHEGFADVVALLSVFRLPAVLDAALAVQDFGADRRIPATAVEARALTKNSLLQLANEMGRALSAARGHALRSSLKLKPPIDLDTPEFREPHRRGEVLVAAMLNGFLEIWVARLKELARHEGRLDPARPEERWLNRDRVVEEGVEVSQRLLHAAIRAIDYCPPVALTFGEYLSALLTADWAICPDDTKYRLRRVIRESFERFGIQPASAKGPDVGLWEPAPQGLSYAGVHFDSLQADTDEMFRFVWENRQTLELYRDAYTCVQSVRPSFRVSADGFVLRETVAEYIQIVNLSGRDLRRLKLRRPPDMDADQPIRLYGGGTLVFDEFGRLGFHIYNPVAGRRQQKRLEYLWEHGMLGAPGPQSLEHFHRARAVALPHDPREEW